MGQLVLASLLFDITMDGEASADDDELRDSLLLSGLRWWR
jgi:hypothetical protein